MKETGFARTARLRKTILLATVSIPALALSAGAARTQEIIDGGEVVTVPGDRPNPWSIGTFLVVGDLTTGTLSIEASGEVENTQGVIGRGSGSEGAVTVTGSGATWTNNSNLAVGDGGTGALSIEAGGAVSNADAFIGVDSGSEGAVTVTGATWTNSGDISVGGFGTGTLSIEAGGTVDNGDGSIGVQSGSDGAVTVTGAGSTWTNSGGLAVGLDGAGTLSIEAGGTVNNTVGVIADFSGSEGAVTVTGADSTWTNSGSLSVGNAGSGTLSIEAGGTVNNAAGFLGAILDSHGAVTVTGSGSTWTNSGNLFIGNEGSGTLSIEAGGTVSNDVGVIGNVSGSHGAITVTGAGSTWANSGDLVVGSSGAGFLTIRAGGVVNNDVGIIGESTGSEGSVTVTGPGSRWTYSDLSVGNSGNGTLTLADGGTASVSAGGAGNVFVARFSGSVGTVNIGAAAGQAATLPGTLQAAGVEFGAGTGTLNFNHTETDYTFAPAISGAGTLNQIAGVTRLTADSSGFTGSTHLTGGTLIVDGALGGSMEVLAGRLAGSGEVGSTTMDGGTIAPGDSIGTLTVDGDLTVGSGAVYEVEVDPAGSASDLIQVTGTADLEGGPVVHVGLGGTYAPSSSYTILSADGGIEGTFGTVNSSFAFLDAEVDYVGNDAILQLLRNEVAFVDEARTRNQRAVAGTLDEVEAGASGDLETVIETIVGLDGDEARAAFDQLSGEAYATLAGLMMDGHALFGQTVTRRLATLRAARPAAEPGSAGAMAFTGGQLASTGLARRLSLARAAIAGGASGSEPVREGLWARGYGTFDDLDGDGNAGGGDATFGGIAFGLDHRFAPDLLGGISLNYARADIDFDRGGSGDVDGYTVGPYGSYERGPVYVDAVASYTYLDNAVDRPVTVGDLHRRAKADYSGHRAARATSRRAIASPWATGWSCSPWPRRSTPACTRKASTRAAPATSISRARAAIPTASRPGSACGSAGRSR